MLPTMTNRNVARDTGRLSRRFFPEVDYLFDEFFGRPMSSWSAWTPSADLFETDDEFVLEMDLPGFEHDDIELTVERNVLTVSGRRPAAEEEAEVTYHLRERNTDRFSRSFALPRSVDADDVTARFSDGILTVTLPKVAEAKPRRIEVEAR